MKDSNNIQSKVNNEDLGQLVIVLTAFVLVVGSFVTFLIAEGSLFN